MNENYRNASQITDYCNDSFGMNMQAINTEGKGVHEIDEISEMLDQIVNLTIDDQEGLFAIIVCEDSEVKKLQNLLGSYSAKFQDLTEEVELDKGKWNILLVNDSKGLEFNTVIVFDNLMSRNQRYIAYTRALDELYVCPTALVKKRNNNEDKLGHDNKSLNDQVDITLDLDSVDSETSNTDDFASMLEDSFNKVDDDDLIREDDSNFNLISNALINHSLNKYDLFKSLNYCNYMLLRKEGKTLDKYKKCFCGGRIIDKKAIKLLFKIGNEDAYIFVKGKQCEKCEKAFVQKTSVLNEINSKYALNDKDYLPDEEEKGFLHMRN